MKDSFSMRLRKAKNRQHITMEALAMESDVSISLVQKMLQGKTENPTMETLVKLSKALDVSTDYLCGLEKP